MIRKPSLFEDTIVSDQASSLLSEAAGQQLYWMRLPDD
jgi:hypothetical protein